MSIQIRKARLEDVHGIRSVCVEGWWATYTNLLSKEYIEQVIREFYNTERLTKEVSNPQGWNGWYVAISNGQVIGAGGGGLINSDTGDVFVLYLDPTKRGNGVGTLLLNAITDEMRAQGAKEQWVTVTEGNEKGLPFYRARGFVEQSRVPAWRHSNEFNYFSIRMKRPV